MNKGDTVYTKSGEIAVVTRVENGQVYGIFCTGPLNDSVNCWGELNEFLLVIEDVAA